jgi:cell division protein FtsN
VNHIRKISPVSSLPSRSRGGTLFGIFIGMTLGACIVALAVWFFNRGDNPFHPAQQQPAPTPGAQQSGTDAPPVALPGKPGDRPVEKPTFTFYNVLPNGEGAASQNPSPAPSSAPAPAPAPAPASPLPLPQPPQTTAQPVGPGVPPAAPAVPTAPAKALYLQLGAFENAEQADNLKAQLLLMGMEPITQRAQLPDGRVVHRIRVGPYTSDEDLASARSRLASSGITGNVVSSGQ